MSLMESLQQIVLLPEGTLILIQDRKICPVLDCYKVLTGWELKKDNRFCFTHHNTSQVLPYHCSKCGTVIYSKRVRRPQALCGDCIHEAKKLRHREYYARIRELNTGQ